MINKEKKFAGQAEKCALKCNAERLTKNTLVFLETLTCTNC